MCFDRIDITDVWGTFQNKLKKGDFCHRFKVSKLWTTIEFKSQWVCWLGINVISDLSTFAIENWQNVPGSLLEEMLLDRESFLLDPAAGW